MSIKKPNEYEQAIEDYAEAACRLKQAQKTLDDATKELAAAKEQRHQRWCEMREYVNTGKIEHGIYRLKGGPGPFASGVLIDGDGRYPDVFPMFR